MSLLRCFSVYQLVLCQLDRVRATFPPHSVPAVVPSQGQPRGTFVQESEGRYEAVVILLAEGWRGARRCCGSGDHRRAVHLIGGLPGTPPAPSHSPPSAPVCPGPAARAAAGGGHLLPQELSHITETGGTETDAGFWLSLWVPGGSSFSSLPSFLPSCRCF